MSTATRSFSGTHPYRSECVRGIVELTASLNEVPDAAMQADAMAGYVDGALEQGCCPRCGGPLLPDDHPDVWMPAGSRETLCRCIPICGECGGDEATCDVSILSWPIDAEDMHHRRAEMMKHFAPVELTPEDVAKIRPARMTGGWGELGMTDSDGGGTR